MDIIRWEFPGTAPGQLLPRNMMILIRRRGAIFITAKMVLIWWSLFWLWHHIQLQLLGVEQIHSKLFFARELDITELLT